MAAGKQTYKPGKSPLRQVLGQNRATAIDSIVTQAQRGGAERQTGFPYGKPRRGR